MATEGVNNNETSKYLYDTLTKKKNQANSTLSVDSFLQLIAAQLSNQDPLNPTSETDFMAQMAQFTALQATQNMSLQTSTSYAASLVGKEITAAKVLANGDYVETTGVVTGVSFFEGAPVIYIDKEAYWLEQIMCVGKLPEKPEEGGDKGDEDKGDEDKGSDTTK